VFNYVGRLAISGYYIVATRIIRSMYVFISRSSIVSFFENRTEETRMPIYLRGGIREYFPAGGRPYKLITNKLGSDISSGISHVISEIPLSAIGPMLQY